MFTSFSIKKKWGERRDLNPRPLEPQSRALPTELRPPYFYVLNYTKPIVAKFNLSLSLCKENANYLITRRWLRSRGVFDRDSEVGLSLVFRGFSFFSGLDAGLSTISLTV